MNKKYTVAVIGATGSVGGEILKNLDERKFPIKKMVAVASENSVGREVSFGEDSIKVTQINKLDFSEIDIAFFCAGTEISQKYIKIAKENNCIIIDKSPLYRMDEDTPLIVPEANGHSLKGFSSGIIANPNCCVIPLATILKPLDEDTKIKRVVISTYQSVSGAGKAGMDELYNQTKAKFVFQTPEPSVFSEQIAFNIIPQIGDLDESGDSDEEQKISEELTKILGSHVKTSVTSVRIPVFVSHSMSVNVEFTEEMNANDVEEVLYEADGVIVNSIGNEHQYTTPVDAVGCDDVFVSRIRNDKSQKNSVNMWICTDNLRKGAALNAVQIAEEITKN